MERPQDIVGHLTTEELFRRHGGFVTRYLSRFGVPAEQLDDAVQEVFLVVHRNGGYRPGVAKPTSYLANIAIRAAAAHRRRQGGDRKRRSEAVVEELQGGSEDPAHAFQVQQDLQKLQRALAGLPEDLRAVLVLVEIEGESCLSVAAGLGCPVGTIYWRLHEARKQLQSAFLSVDVARGKWRPTAAEPKRALPARSMIMLFSLDGFRNSEADRLLQLARESSTELPIDAMVERHQQLVASGAELPPWAASYVPHSASWLSLLGAGPITVGLGMAGAALAVVLLTSTEAPLPAPQSLASPDAQTAKHRQLGDVEASALEKSRAASGAQAPLEDDVDRAARARHADAHPFAAGRTSREARAVGVRGSVVRKSTASAPELSAAGQIAASAPVEARGSAREQHVEARGSALTEPDSEPTASPSTPPQTPDKKAQEVRAAAPDKELMEMREIAQAESLLPRDPARALALTRAMRQRFPDGYFREERAYVEVMALSQLQRTGELRERADAFLRAYPNGPYSERVKRTAGR